MDNKIEVGDIVCVNFNNIQYTLCSKAEVQYVPCATGDSWVFKDLDINSDSFKIHYVSEGCTVTLIEKRQDSLIAVMCGNERNR